MKTCSTILPTFTCALDPNPLDGLDDASEAPLYFLDSMPKLMIEFGPLAGALDEQLESEEQLPSSKRKILGKDVAPEFDSDLLVDPKGPADKLSSLGQTLPFSPSV